MTLFLAKAAPPVDGATVAGVEAAAAAFKWLLEWELSCGGPSVK